MSDKFIWGAPSMIFLVGGIQTFYNAIAEGVWISALIFLVLSFIGAFGTNRFFFSRLFLDSQQFKLKDLRGDVVNLPLSSIEAIGDVRFKRSLYSTQTGEVDFKKAESVEFILKDGNTKIIGVGRFQGSPKEELFKALLQIL